MLQCAKMSTFIRGESLLYRSPDGVPGGDTGIFGIVSNLLSASPIPGNPQEIQAFQACKDAIDGRAYNSTFSDNPMLKCAIQAVLERIDRPGQEISPLVAQIIDTVAKSPNRQEVSELLLPAVASPLVGDRVIGIINGKLNLLSPEKKSLFHSMQAKRKIYDNEDPVQVATQLALQLAGEQEPLPKELTSFNSTYIQPAASLIDAMIKMRKTDDEIKNVTNLFQQTYVSAAFEALPLCQQDALCEIFIGKPTSYADFVAWLSQAAARLVPLFHADQPHGREGVLIEALVRKQLSDTARSIFESSEKIIQSLCQNKKYDILPQGVVERMVYYDLPEKYSAEVIIGRIRSLILNFPSRLSIDNVPFFNEIKRILGDGKLQTIIARENALTKESIQKSRAGLITYIDSWIEANLQPSDNYFLSTIASPNE